MEEQKRRREERIERKRRTRYDEREEHSRGGEGRPMREWGRKVELLPSPPPASLRMDYSPTVTVQSEADGGSVMENRQARAAAKLLSIKGAAKDLAAPPANVNGNMTEADTKRQKLLDRLAKLKSEYTTKTPPLSDHKNDPAIPPTDGDGDGDGGAEPDVDVEVEVVKGRGTSRSINRARIQLKLKLESEKKTFRHSLNISKAQELRQRLLETKARREAEETDATLRRLDLVDRKRELRRRLMVVKMMAAETGQERRARELRERLMARKMELASGIGIGSATVTVTGMPGSMVAV